MSPVISHPLARFLVTVLAIVALASGCATFETARHLIGAAPQPRDSLTLEQLEVAEREVDKARWAVEDAMMELAIAQRHVAETKRELASARRVLTADRGLIAEVERLSEDTINMVKNLIVEAGDAAEGSSGPPPTR